MTDNPERLQDRAARALCLSCPDLEWCGAAKPGKAQIPEEEDHMHAYSGRDWHIV